MAKPEKSGPRGFRPRALGEVAIRCADLPAMRAFYEGELGLTVLADRGGIVFFDLGPGYAGHRTVLALFDHRPARAQFARPEGPPVTGARSSLHHLALTLGPEEQDAAIAWLRGRGHDVRIEDFPWIGWRGAFLNDPEGNTVELVAKVAAGADEAGGRQDGFRTDA